MQLDNMDCHFFKEELMSKNENLKAVTSKVKVLGK